MSIEAEDAARSVVVLNDFGTINGGASKVAIESAYGLARRGHAVTYFCAVGPVDKRLRDAGVNIVCLDQTASLDNPNRLKGAFHNLWNGVASRALAGVLAEVPRETVVHVHSWCKALSPSALEAVRRSRLATVVTIHDYFLACPNGGLFDYQSKTICPLTPLSVACVTRQCDKQSYAMKAFRVLRQVVQNNAIGRPMAPWHFAAVSNFALSKIAAFLPSWAPRSVLPNPLDLVQQPPAEPARSDVFLAVGRLSPEKGMVEFAEAVRHAGVRGAVIGAGESEHVVRAANPDLEMLGWLDHAQSLAKIREARALVFPSLWPETLGLTPLEASAQGVPPIISRETGASDWIVDGRNGLHAPPGDVAALADRITRLKDDALVARLGRAAYDDYWASAPTLEKHIEGLESIYSAVLSRTDRSLAPA